MSMIWAIKSCSIIEHYSRAKWPNHLVCNLGSLSPFILNTDKPGTDGTTLLCLLYPPEDGNCNSGHVFQDWGFTINGLLTDLCFN